MTLTVSMPLHLASAVTITSAGRRRPVATITASGSLSPRAARNSAASLATGGESSTIRTWAARRSTISRARSPARTGSGDRALSPRLQRLPLARLGTHVLRIGADQAVVGVLLADVGGPAGHAGGGEQGGVEVGGELEGRVDAGRVEVDVGVEGLLLHDRLLDPDRGVVPAGVAELPAQALGDLAQHGGPRVPGLVDAVAEAHDLLLVGQAGPDPVGGPVGRADVLQHLPDALDGPAVQRALEGGHGGGGRGVHVGQ